MSKMKIVVLDGYTANPGDLSWEGLELLGEVTVYDRTKPNETVARAAEAEIVITNKVVIGREEMAQLPHLIYIGVLATGYNVVDIAAARDRGIIVTNVPAYSTESVAYAIENRQGRWSSNPDFCYYANSITELADKTFGIVGLGNIGQRVAQIAQAFGMKVKAFTSKPAEALPEGIQKADLKELFQTSDIISLHCPLTPDTHHLIKAETIAWMNPETILINTGRGPLVDDAALAEALKAGRLKAYCADVMTEEPPKADNPILQVDNAYITPHIAWATKEARQRLLQIATANVSAFLKDTPQNVIG